MILVTGGLGMIGAHTARALVVTTLPSAVEELFRQREERQRP